MGRISRSIALVKQSYGVLMQDKELLILPVLSGLTILVVCAGFVLGMGFLDEGALDRDEATWILPSLLFYIVTYTVGIFFQAAIIAGASERLAGGDPTLGSALGAAGRRFPAILMWGVIAGTVGMLLRAVQERSEVVGKIIIGIIGVVWSLATFFMVPVLVMEKRSIGDSFRHSWGLFKETWGETVVGNVGLGIVQFLCFLPLIAICALLWSGGMEIVAIVVGIVGIAVLSVFFSALQAVFVASLYRYAVAGEVADGFDRALMETAFRPK
ncbi:MAG: DUF6159 family protein [Planctomycetota bacterium]|jgi:hypothetical protein